MNRLLPTMITIEDSSQVGEARRVAGEFAHRAGLSETKIGGFALIATELATNLIKHGGGGRLGVGSFDDADGQGIELLAMDRGRGIANLDQSMEDGYSTAGSPGTGLGAIARRADHLRVYSRSGLGSVLLARVVTAPPKERFQIAIGAAVASYPGEIACGDAWAFAQVPAGPTLLVADGSGHGPLAAAAAATAVAIFEAHAGEACVRIVERLHAALAGTRGAAVAVARIDPVDNLVRFVGVGNIGATLVGLGELSHMVSHNGTAGHVAPRIREFTYPYGPDQTVILHSDGIGTRWTLNGYPGLAVRHPGLIAGVLIRDHLRGRDDASVAAMRLQPP